MGPDMDIKFHQVVMKIVRYDITKVKQRKPKKPSDSDSETFIYSLIPCFSHILNIVWKQNVITLLDSVWLLHGSSHYFL